MDPSPSSTTPPQLAPPGAGLPFFESWIVRLFGRRMIHRRFTRESALDAIEQTARRMLDKTAPFSPEQLITPKLIPRLRGLEDSSRFWSPSMVLEHLCITGRGMVQVILMLTHGKRPDRVASTATVKPVGRDHTEVRAEFTTLHGGVRQQLATSAGSDWDRLTYNHPWFGPLTASEWVRMMATHLHLHEGQLDLILQTAAPRHTEK